MSTRISSKKSRCIAKRPESAEVAVKPGLFEYPQPPHAVLKPHSSVVLPHSSGKKVWSLRGKKFVWAHGRPNPVHSEGGDLPRGAGLPRQLTRLGCHGIVPMLRSSGGGRRARQRTLAKADLGRSGSFDALGREGTTFWTTEGGGHTGIRARSSVSISAMSLHCQWMAAPASPSTATPTA